MSNPEVGLQQISEFHWLSEGVEQKHGTFIYKLVLLLNCYIFAIVYN